MGKRMFQPPLGIDIKDSDTNPTHVTIIGGIVVLNTYKFDNQLIFMVQWPWQKNNLECKYLIKHYGYSGKVSGIEIPNVKLGELSIEPKLLQGASQVLELIDA